ncbi:hypothetical protein [Actinoplanes sp. NPDC051859]|uniref:hypothetical protein n=1 Tax=Actinoplanes sp. NPDC051859 TaxID=3363909 RepID=UPI003791ACEA
MSDDVDVDEPPGIRVDQLQAGDRVLMFGRVIRIVTVQPLKDAPDLRALSIKTGDSTRLCDTVLRADWKVIAVQAPRTLNLTCIQCGQQAPVDVNLAQPAPRYPICRICARG